MPWWRITFLSDEKQLIDVDVKFWRVEAGMLKMTRLEHGVLWMGSVNIRTVTNMMCLGGGP